MGIVHRRVFIGKVGKAEEIVTVLQEGDKLLQQYGGDFKSRILTDYMSGRTDRVVAEWEVNDLNAIDSAMERVVSDPQAQAAFKTWMERLEGLIHYARGRELVRPLAPSLMTESTQRRLLAVMAHPDDEVFGCGGALARYAAEGAKVTLICATRGEAGEISDPSLANRDDLGRVREQELRAACDVLGIGEPFVFGYRDSGMAGTPDNEHPRALCRADRHELVGHIVKIIRQARPQVLLTFDPNGGYGHPDHIAIHHASREAFFAADIGSMFPEQLSDGLTPHQTSKLYYIAMVRSMLRAFREAAEAAGMLSDISDMDPEKMGVPDEEITTLVDVAKYADQKARAAQCHRTQVGGDDVFAWIPESVRTRFLSTEHLIRAEPPFQRNNEATESDLFERING